MILFLCGLALMAGLIGFLSGLSSSPIIDTLLPLLFALITAGGNAYILLGKGDKKADLKLGVDAQRAGFIGAQLLIFTLFFLPGLWTGVAVKFNPDSLWPQPKNKPIYADISDDNPAVVNLLRTYDITMINDGIGKEKRKKILLEIHKTKTKWADKTNLLTNTKTSHGIDITRSTPVIDRGGPFSNLGEFIRTSEGDETRSGTQSPKDSTPNNED